MRENLSRYTLDEGGRVYTDDEQLFLPSVTTILNQRPTPYGIKVWKRNNNGKNGNPHWRDILSYKSNRGTMIHYNLLNEFSEGDMFGQNEEDSTEELKLNGEWAEYRRDLTYAEEAWERIKEIRGISPDSVIDVECFVVNTGVGYAGQFDLLYIDKDSNICLSDLKTGKGIYEKYKLQLSAYENAVELPIDTLEIIRINPDTETWEVSQDSDWKEDREDLWNEYRELRLQMGDVENEMKEIAETGVEDG